MGAHKSRMTKERLEHIAETTACKFSLLGSSIALNKKINKITKKTEGVTCFIEIPKLFWYKTF